MRLPRRLLPLLAATLPLAAADWEWSLNLDSFAAWEDETLFGLGHTSLLERLRLNLEAALGDGFSLELAYELDGFYREGIGAVPGGTLLFDQGVGRRCDESAPAAGGRVHDGIVGEDVEVAERPRGRTAFDGQRA